MHRVRCISSAAGKGRGANRVRLGSMLAIATSAALGVVLYLRQQRSIRMDWSMGDMEPEGAGLNLSGGAV